MESLRPQGSGVTGALRGTRNLAVLGMVLVAGLLVGAQTVEKFAPPRTAVVDISLVFESYAKKIDKQAVLQKDMEALKAILADLEKQYAMISAEIAQLEETSPLYIDKLVAKKELELRVMQLKNTKLNELRNQQIEFLREIREEITQEVEEYAKTHDLDLVLEKQVQVDADGGGMSFRWPIVHFSATRLEITDAITTRLNEKYKRNT